MRWASQRKTPADNGGSSHIQHKHQNLHLEIRDWKKNKSETPSPVPKMLEQVPTVDDPLQWTLLHVDRVLADRLPWYRSLSLDDKTTIHLLIESFESSFMNWWNQGRRRLDTRDGIDPKADSMPIPAPSDYPQTLSPNRTLDLIQAILDLLEDGLPLPARREGNREHIKDAFLHYARRVAFSSAKSYTTLIKTDQKTQSRTETLILESLIEGSANRQVRAGLTMLGWSADYQSFALLGKLVNIDNQGDTEQDIRTEVEKEGAQALVAEHNQLNLILINLQDADTPVNVSASLLHFFDRKTPVCMGPLRQGVKGSSETIQAALNTYAVAPAASSLAVEGMLPRPLHADDLLPERALMGDKNAADQLYREVYKSLSGDDQNSPLLLTLGTFLMSGNALETTAKKLGIHPNTVRYRLKRSVEVTGWDVMNPREAFVLQTALKIGRIRDAGEGEIREELS